MASGLCARAAASCMGGGSELYGRMTSPSMWRSLALLLAWVEGVAHLDLSEAAAGGKNLNAALKSSWASTPLVRTSLRHLYGSHQWFVWGGAGAGLYGSGQ